MVNEVSLLDVEQNSDGFLTGWIVTAVRDSG